MITQERVEVTEYGGAYTIVYFQDAEGNPAEKEKAVRFEAVEYDESDEPIMRTYGRFETLQ